MCSCCFLVFLPRFCIKNHFIFLFLLRVMEDQQEQEANSPSQGSERNEPVRSRWTPKPEQILILESIFNSGMVNPPKDETVRIRKLLEKFGSVGDANVFYWFQNRRSRSRRRQRQMQANLEQRNQAQPQPQLVVTSTCGATQLFESSSGFSFGPLSSPSYHLGSSSSSCGVMGNDVAVDQCLFSVSGQMGFPEIEQSSAVTPGLCASDTSNLQSQSGKCMADDSVSVSHILFFFLKFEIYNIWKRI